MIIMQNESITGKKIGLHFYNKYAEQAILTLLDKKMGTHALIFDHFPPSDVDVAITDNLPSRLVANHNARTHQSIFFLGNSASKDRFQGENINFIDLRTPLKKLIAQLSGEQQNTHLKDNITIPCISLSVREQMVINHLKNRKEYGTINTMTTESDRKKYSYSIRNIMKKLGFSNKLHLYKWIIKL